MLSYLVDDLVHNKRDNEAMGIMTRNGLQAYVRQDTLTKLEGFVYDPSTDTSLESEGHYGSVCQPASDYLQMPAHVKLEWIGTDEDVPKLEALLEEPLIGVDSEWRPELTQYHRTRPSLFQISGEKTAFLIDLVSLQRSKPLDEMLTRVFTNKDSIIIGFGFSSDVEQFARKHPHFMFMRYIERFVDAQSYYGKVCLVE